VATIAYIRTSSIAVRPATAAAMEAFSLQAFSSSGTAVAVAAVVVRRGSLITRLASGLMAPAFLYVTSAFSKTSTTKMAT